MYYEKTGKLAAPDREPGEANCTPEQAVELARYCPGEPFEKIRQFGTWQAAKMLSEAHRFEQQARADISRAEEAKDKTQHRGCLVTLLQFIGVVFLLVCLWIVFAMK